VLAALPLSFEYELRWVIQSGYNWRFGSVLGQIRTTAKLIRDALSADFISGFLLGCTIQWKG
jgi:hypothetical protein